MFNTITQTTTQRNILTNIHTPGNINLPLVPTTQQVLPTIVTNSLDYFINLEPGLVTDKIIHYQAIPNRLSLNFYVGLYIVNLPVTTYP